MSFFFGNTPASIIELEDDGSHTVGAGLYGYAIVNPGLGAQVTINAGNVANGEHQVSSGSVSSGSPLSYTVPNGFVGHLAITITGTHTGLNVAHEGSTVLGANGTYTYKASGGSTLAITVSTGTANYEISRYGMTMTGGASYIKPVTAGDAVVGSCTIYLWYKP